MRIFYQLISPLLIVTILSFTTLQPSPSAAGTVSMVEGSGEEPPPREGKRPATALLLGIFVIGGAQYYTGDTWWGIISSLIGYTSLISAGYICYFFYTTSWEVYGTFLSNLLPVSLFTILVLVASTTWAISLYSGYRKAEKGE